MEPFIKHNLSMQYFYSNFTPFLFYTLQCFMGETWIEKVTDLSDFCFC